ncbi:hypothetical protein CHARACLAT_032785, partial [Characodon lateralis]|nr:hypothetical protein [Characodon lateralis]
KTTTSDPPTTRDLPPATASIFIRLVCHLVVFCPYFISTLLLLSLYRERTTGKVPPVSKITSSFHARQGFNVDYDDVMTAVTTRDYF